MKLHWSQDLKGDIKDFSSGGGAGLLPLKGGYVKYTLIWWIWGPYLILACFKNK